MVQYPHVPDEVRGGDAGRETQRGSTGSDGGADCSGVAWQEKPIG